MQVLASEEYGLRCLLQVAEAEQRAPDRPLSVAAVAEAEGLSPEYAAKLLRTLRLAGLVASTRGAGGGYRLARPAREISAWEAVCALGGDPFPEHFCACHASPGASGAPRAGRRAECVHGRSCAVRSLWRRLAGVLRSELERVTLHDLGRDERAMNDFLQVAAATEASRAWPS